MKKNIKFIFAVFLVSIIISCLLSGIKSGMSLSYGWGGMRNLEKFGFPFSWRAPCPISHDPISAPTGCIDGFNLIAFIFDILIFAVFLFLLVKLVKRLRDASSNTEQAKQQVNQKIAIPAKTKFAAWWIIISGVLFMVSGSILMGLWYYKDIFPTWIGFIMLAILSFGRIMLISWIIASVLCLLGLFILKGKKVAWWLVTIFLFGVIVLLGYWVYFWFLAEEYGASLFIVFILILFAKPFIVFILDRKNFFKAVPTNRGSNIVA